MKKLLKRLAIGGVCALVIALALLHTTPVENLLLSRLKKQLATYGVVFDAAKLDLNLFRLKVRLRQLAVEAYGVNAEIDDVSVNASSGLLFGRIILDSVVMADGVITYAPSPSSAAPASESTTAAGSESGTGFEMPAISLGRLDVHNLQAKAGEQVLPLDLSVMDINAVYGNDQFESAWRVPAVSEIPEINGSLKATTKTFQVFENIDFRLSGGAHELQVHGSVLQGFRPELSISGRLGPETPLGMPVVLEAGLGPRLARANVQLETEVAGATRNVAVSTTFDYTAEALEIPLEIIMDELMNGKVDARRDGADWSVFFTFQGDPARIRAEFPPLDIDVLTIEGEATVPGADPTAASADVRVRMDGGQRLAMDAVYRDRQLTFSGDGEPLQGVRFNMNGGYENELTATFDAVVDEPEVLAPLVALPGGLCGGPALVRGALVFQPADGLAGLTITELRARQLDLQYDDQPLGDVQIYAAGPPDRLQGSVFIAALNPQRDALSFELDLLDRAWRGLVLDVQAAALPLAGFAFDLQLGAAGDGPLTSPNLSGTLSGGVAADGAPAATYQSTFDWRDGALRLPDLQARTAQTALRADLAVADTNAAFDAMQWRLDLRAERADHSEFTTLVPVDLPQFGFALRGDQDLLDAALSLPDQYYGELHLPITMAGPLKLRIDPRNLDVDAHMSGVLVGGIGLQELGVRLSDGRIVAAGEYSLLDDQAFENLICDFLPAPLEPGDLVFDHLQGVFTAHTLLEDPVAQARIELAVDQLQGDIRGETFTSNDIVLAYQDGPIIEPFDIQLPGISVAVGQELQDTDAWLIAVNTNLRHDDCLQRLASDFWPENFVLNEAQLGLELKLDKDFSNPRVAFSTHNLSAVYDDKELAVQGLSGSYDEAGLRFTTGDIRVQDLLLNVEPLADGFTISGRPTAGDIGEWVDGIVGDAVFEAAFTYRNGDDLPLLTGDLVQRQGRLIRIEPYLAVSDAGLAFKIERDGGLTIQSGAAKVNEGTVSFSGEANPLTGEALIRGFAETVQLEAMDAHVNATASLEWAADPETEGSKLTLTTFLNSGYLNPEFNVREFVQSYISAVPELYFPDPLLETVEVQVVVLAAEDNPIILENSMAFMEIETPSIIITGNLAEPVVSSGLININAGSTVELGNQSFVFKDSQIAFHADRPDDPFLDLVMESTQFQNKNTIAINSYLSGLGESLGENDLTSILASYLIGNVASFLSLENVDTLFAGGATAVASRQLARKLLARYSYPISEPENQRAEIVYGPLSRNYFVFGNQNDVSGAAILHQRRLSFPEGSRPQRIRRVRILPEDTPRWVKRKLELSRDDDYTDTQWRRAEIMLRRRLKSMGHLTPDISHSFEERVLTVNVDFGPKTELIVEGLVLSEEETSDILSGVFAVDDAGLRDIADKLERKAYNLGHPSAAAIVERRGDDLHAQVYVGLMTENILLDFGAAQALLDPGYASEAAKRQFLATYFKSEGAARAQIRARLAAKGYLLPILGEGDFRDLNDFYLPIELGPQANLADVLEDGESLNSPLIDGSFSITTIANLRTDLTKERGQDVTFNIKPRRVGPDVVLEVRAFKREDPLVEELNIETDGRVDAERVRRYLGFREPGQRSDFIKSLRSTFGFGNDDGMRQSELFQLQRELTEDGPFQSARLQRDGSGASLTLEEHNRYDANLRVTWDERDDFGVAVQFTDHMAFHGINDWSINLSRNSNEERLLGNLRFQHIFGTQLDWNISVDIENDLEDGPFKDPFGDGFEISNTTRDLRRRYTTGSTYPLTRYQTIETSVFFERRTIEETFRPGVLFADPPEPLPDPDPAFINITENTNDTVGARFSWVYRRLDSNVDPRNGIFAALTAERQFGDSGGDASGLDEQNTRLTARLSTFKSWDRLLWAQRFEWGRYRLDDPSRPDDIEDSDFFLLGGSANVRGFSREFLGPLDQTTFQPIGGEGLAFFSQEFTYDIGYQGLGISPFIDGGWVWENYEDTFSTPLVVTGGLGVVWNSPIGYFRLDYAELISDGSFERLIQELENPFSDIDERAAIRSEALSEWSFRFGRVF